MNSTKRYVVAALWCFTTSAVTFLAQLLKWTCFNGDFNFGPSALIVSRELNQATLKRLTAALSIQTRPAQLAAEILQDLQTGSGGYVYDSAGKT